MTRIPKSIKFKARQKDRNFVYTILKLEGKGFNKKICVSIDKLICETGSKVYKSLKHWDDVEITIRGKERRK